MSTAIPSFCPAAPSPPRDGPRIESPVAMNRQERRAVRRSELSFMLDEACDWIDRFMVLPSQHARDLMALWAAASGARIDGRLIWSMAARLAMISDDPGSGKSTATRILALLSYKGRKEEDWSGPGLLQCIAEDQITVGIDEFDVLLDGSGGGQKTMRAILNGGAYPDGAISRAGNKGTSSFCWLTICGLAYVYRTHSRLAAFRTRSIPIELREARDDELDRLTEFDRYTHAPLLRMLGEAMAEHVGRNAKRLAKMERTAIVPPGVRAREREKWRPMLAVGELAGDDWADRARAACRWFSLGESDDQRPGLTPRQRLVTDMETAMCGEERVRSLVLLQRLEEMGWPFPTADPDVDPETNRSSAQELSAMLGGYLRPSKQRIDGRPVQCYALADVVELREAIVPPERSDRGDCSDRSDCSDPATHVAYEDVEPEDALVC